jgi:hypothetical protein
MQLRLESKLQLVLGDGNKLKLELQHRQLTLTLVGRCCRAAERRSSGAPTEHHLIDAEV